MGPRERKKLKWPLEKISVGIEQCIIVSSVGIVAGRGGVFGEGKCFISVGHPRRPGWG